jgi:1-acyl-sn-glycerol-3-phosphate acyltransferase
MSDATYRWARRICLPPFWLSSRPCVLHAERASIPGGYILAPNHTSPFDSPLLIRHTPRHIDFMSATDVRGNPLWQAFLQLFNIYPVDRRRPDSSAVRATIRRLRQGRVVGIFPEGAIRAGTDSVVHGGDIDPGIQRLAEMAGVPVVPCVVLGAQQYGRPVNWLPLRRTRYGITFGTPLRANPTDEQPDAHEHFLSALGLAYAELSQELTQKMAAPPLLHRV